MVRTVAPSRVRHEVTMKPTVYVETSVISYLTARPSRDVVTLGNQVATQEWWSDAVDRYQLVVSSVVVDESRVGDPAAAHRRRTVLESLRVLATDEEAMTLGRVIVESGACPAGAAADAAHVAVAVVNGVDYLVTWNMRHLANPIAVARIGRICHAAGYEPPIICTPVQLLEAEHGASSG